MRLNQTVIRHGIVTFWAIWFTVVFVTNLCDGAKAMGLLPAEWNFASGNHEFMNTVTGRYPFAQTLTPVMFAGVVLWEAIAAGLFWRLALMDWSDRVRMRQAMHSAFAVGLALWAAFAIVDEIFIRYELEASHLRLFTAQLVSLMFLELVPDSHATDS